MSLSTQNRDLAVQHIRLIVALQPAKIEAVISKLVISAYVVEHLTVLLQHPHELCRLFVIAALESASDCGNVVAVVHEAVLAHHGPPGPVAGVDNTI